MDDLRKHYNVKKDNQRSSFSLLNWWRKNRILLQITGGIFVLLFIIIKPELIGAGLGSWFNRLITSFTSNVEVSIIQWGVTLGSILIGIICYKLFTSVKK
tara:strand:+ start:10734 stop:11033 length:300 start_codon:yes stop_codon:yes gene_type:complete